MLDISAPRAAARRTGEVQDEGLPAIIVLPGRQALSQAMAALSAALLVMQCVQLQRSHAYMVMPTICKHGASATPTLAQLRQ